MKGTFMRPRIPLLIATVTAVTAALVPGQAAAAPAANTAVDTVPAVENLLDPLHIDLARAELSPADQARLDAITAHLPANWQQRLAQVRSDLGIESHGVEEAVAKAIDPSLYECQPTQFSNYANALLDGVDFGTLIILVLLGVLDYPTYDALLYGTPGNKADYGLPEGYKAPVTQAVKQSQKFWDVDLFDVKTMAMQNDMLADHGRMTRIIMALFGDTEEDAAEAATLIMDVIADSPPLQGGDNPIFTLNAFAFSAEGETDPLFKDLPDKMVFGEGLATALDALDLGTTGAKAVVGHEMAHHVQYEQGYFDSPLTGPEATRRTELMADAFGTYFVAHKRGMNFNAVQIHKAEQSFYQVGDCSFESNGHHGTPNQRLKASVWGAELARATTSPFPVLASDTLYNKFEKKLPSFVKPDAKPAA
ncbi:hypothetical protein JCM33774_15040 [Actinophytocola sp. KF-1]